MPKVRRHHNNKGLRQIKNGKTKEQTRKIAKRLGIPHKTLCMFCDGCGWCEGSPAFTCPECKGVGEVTI